MPGWPWRPSFRRPIHGYQEKIGKIYIKCRLIDQAVIEVTVIDRGCGIEDIEKARTPLYTSCTTGERSGMGFTIMETFMDKLWVRSVPGKGTTVKMRKKLGLKRQG